MRTRPAAVAALFFTAFTVNHTRSASQSFDGLWLSEGYGLYFDVSGTTLKAYELTEISCLPSFTAERTGAGAAGEMTFKVVNQSGTYTVRPGGSPDGWRVRRNGAASHMIVRRLASAPTHFMALSAPAHVRPSLPSL